MLTRRGLFKGLLALVGLVVCGPVVFQSASASYGEGVLVPPSGSVYIGNAGRLHLPPGRLFTLFGDSDRRRVMPGRAIQPGTTLLFVPAVCLTDAEHALLETEAKRFGITIQKGCET